MNGYVRIKYPTGLKPGDKILGRVGCRAFSPAKEVLFTPEKQRQIAAQSVVKIVDGPLWFVSQTARLVVISES